MGGFNILVYSGPGIGPNAHAYVLRTLRLFFSHRYAIIQVSPEVLRNEPWESKTAMLVMPGGRDLPYVAEMNGKINDRIKKWVSGGGRYLGFCAGAYYGCGRCEFQPGTALEVAGDRELGLFKGTCLGSAYPGYDYKSESGAYAAELSINRSAFNVPETVWGGDPRNVRIYYNGGGFFLTDEFLGRTIANDKSYSVSVLARYSPDVTDPRNRLQRVTNAPAIISCKVGKGIAVLSGPHIEYSYSFLHPASYTMPHNIHLVEHLRKNDPYRRRLLGAIFKHMKLDVDKDALVDNIGPGGSLRIPSITPSYFAPARASGVAESASTLYKLNSATTKNGSISAGGVSDSVLCDLQDDIHIINAIAGPEKRRIPFEYQRAALKQPQDLDPEPTAEDSDEDAVKPSSVLVLCTQDTVPDNNETPRFDMGLAIKYMQELKAHTIGSWLMYTDTTSSTQTFLEKNTKLQSILPNGTVNLATFQIAGRGRGRNAWVSPVGCLQFTTLLRHPGSKQAPVVLLQYLMALAIVESVKSTPGYEDIPLRLKWPNDLYAKYNATSDSDDSSGSEAPEFVKIGGVMVTSSYKAGEFTLLIGSGINVSNSLPTTSISNLIREYNETHNTQLKTISIELMLAKATAKFEEFYRKFLVHGFRPFLDLYYKNWLHTDQIVSLTDQNYERVKIVGIDSDTGLLLTRSLLNPSATYSLQPDGNSFDMLHGLISRKST